MIAWMLFGCGEDATIVLQDTQNYAFTSTITASSDTIKAGVNTTVDWSGLTVDLLGNPVDPAADITTLQLVHFTEYDQDEVLAGINDDNLLQSDIEGALEFHPEPGQTSVDTSAFNLLGYYLNPETNLVESEGAYLIAAITGDSEFRMFGFFEPRNDAPEAPITLTSDSATLSYTVDLSHGAPIEIPAGNVTIDWSELTTGPSGQPIDLPDIDTLTVARYDESLEELEADFLHVDALSEERWSHDVEGWGDWRLADLEDADGNAFEGVRGDGTWLVALQCSTCLNPAPPFLGVIQQ